MGKVDVEMLTVWHNFKSLSVKMGDPPEAPPHPKTAILSKTARTNYFNGYYA
jgi:hypothetical protein